MVTNTRQRGRISPQDLYRIQTISDPAISPDGRDVVFSVQRVDRDSERKYANLWVAPTGGGAPRQFTHGDQQDTRPRWSPDGTRIAFLSNRGNSTQAQIHIIPFSGGEARPLTGLKGKFGAFEWSPDGSRLAFEFQKRDQDALEREADERKRRLGIVSRHYTRVHYKWDGIGFFGHEQWHIWTVNARTGKVAQLTDGPVHAEREPCWSPDGRHLILSLVTKGVSRLYISTLDGSRLVPLATGYGINVSPSWSPRGDQVVYMSDRLTQKHLYVINIDGSNDHRITFEGGYNGSPAWSPRGDRIAFVGGDLATGRRGGPRRVFNIYTCDVNGSNMVKLTGVRGPEGDNVNPTWSPDGLHILFSSDRVRSGAYHIYRMSWNGGDVHPVITEGNTRQPSWGPRPE